MGATRYCGDCKVMAVPASALTITRQSESAGRALGLSFLGIVCFGFIVAPMAISAALAARKEIAQDPSVGGLGKANAALVIAPVVLLLSVLNVIVRIKGFAK
ncbi:hypothetical protein MYSTI_05403 [Myxococcus stipitatus DSM 14675]|uniref:Uncharacterized protein n=1 Tax=Myxococcus stipitatus (strain DSM 14675 / JCM 12634 / Mx s8) TaxID=1278073 RepID=L7UGH9_MYXSD|nr:hypothetical protein [Myxococcus stipitatus]AGC46682.1 hypothetical protein MYSTI_05403 [Myxococcus stipitatus DSM 14675]